jgi:CRISPR-associated protein Cas2
MARLLLDFGGERVQFSVFECHITERNLERLHERATKILKVDEDSLRFYQLCENCRPKMTLMGVAKPTEEPGLRII